MLCKVLVALLMTLPLGATEPLVVGSKRFVESEILGEIIAQHLSNSGFPVVRRFGLAGTFIAYQALKEKSLDVYVEYTGTLAEAIYKKPGATPAELAAIASSEGLLMLDKLGFNNSFALVVSQSLAEKFQLKTISDLKNHPEFIGALSFEFQQRTDGWPELAKTYGLSNPVRSIENPMTMHALANQEVQFAEVYSTDASIGEFTLVVLRDDLGFFPKYEAFPFIHKELPLTAVNALQQLAHTMSDEVMIELNQRATGEESIPSIAKNFLISRGLGEGAEKIVKRGAVEWQPLLRRTKEHLTLTFLAVFLATLIAIPLAVLIHNVKILAGPLLSITGILQTIPSIALLSFMIPFFGIGFLPALVGLFLYSLLPIVRNTYTALATIDPRLITAARGIGLYPNEVFWAVKLPLSLPVILAGIRTATTINIGTATLGAFIGAGGLGEPIVMGLAMNDTGTILQGALPAAALAVLVDLGFATLTRRFELKM